MSDKPVEEIVIDGSGETPIKTPPQKEKKARKANPWIVKCKEVQARPENAGLSYREILKKAKLEYP